MHNKSYTITRTINTDQMRRLISPKVGLILFVDAQENLEDITNIQIWQRLKTPVKINLK